MSVLRILVDESASADRWGVGVVIEHNQMGFHYGGANSDLGDLQEQAGQSLSAVIGTFGMYCGCSVAAQYMHRHPGERCAIDIVTDTSSVLQTYQAGMVARPTLTACFRFLERGLLKLLEYVVYVQMTHKIEYGYGDNWPPHHMATKGRECDMHTIRFRDPLEGLIEFFNCVWDEHGLVRRVYIRKVISDVVDQGPTSASTSTSTCTCD